MVVLVLRLEVVLATATSLVWLQSSLRCLPVITQRLFSIVSPAHLLRLPCDADIFPALTA